MKKTLKEIRKEFESAPESRWEQLAFLYREDDRAGVKKLAESFLKKRRALEKERRRVEAHVRLRKKNTGTRNLYAASMRRAEALWRDRLWREPWFCPKTPGFSISMIPSSCRKKKREELYEIILSRALAVGVGYASPARIDEINILNATYEAMRQAVGKLSLRPSLLLNDAVKIPELDITQVPIIKGDAKSQSIAAASIVAKVTRDRLMREYDRLMPEYGFASHKGYGSREHIEALKKYGPSPIHRASFIAHFL